jgi:hypothetical protein
MIEWLTEFLSSSNLTWQRALWGVLIFVITFAGSIALVSFILVRLPPTYFQLSHARDFWKDRHVALRLSMILFKNLLGLILVLFGIIMLIGPGQGILTILLGIMLLDFPGKRRLERKIVGRPKVFRAINNLRARFGSPPLVLD